MKTVFVRDEIVPGVNDQCCVVPADIPSMAAGNAEHRAAVANLERIAQIAKLSAKFDRVIALLKRQKAQDTAMYEQVEARRALRLEGTDTTLLPTAEEWLDQHNRAYAARAAQICAEAKAAYDARNPHKRGEAAR